MNQTTPYNEVAARYGLEPVPESVIRLTQLVAEQDADLDKIAKVIEQDKALTARLLRAANPRADDEEDYGIMALVPLASEDQLSMADTRRLLAARRIVDERWREKPTLEAIARACGLNRDKLTRGFRALYGRSVGEALAERRLGHASAMLLTTDKPVSSIGYENGYLSNASFARAFSRRFGVSPSDYRSCGVMS